ncbi:MAG TPA: UDP-glucose 4-epimerase GalE [Bryobacteraceae bacterium]|nr:UDP-glucose 4-epimerase GalE [Bryobacteraceae bacterium]
MPKILVTGGAGYIGSVTAHLLARRGYDVVIVDDLSRGHQHAVGSLPFHRLNLAETPALADLLAREKVDAVVHFAGYIAVGESTQKPELYFSNNVGGTISLFNAMSLARVKRLVFSSTAAVYGIPDKVPIQEDAPLIPVNPYGETKLMIERTLGWLDRHSGLHSIALRYFNACGSDPESGLGEEHHPETHLIPLLLEAVVTGNPVTLFGDDYDTPDGTCIRDYIHVVDLAEAHVLALDHLLAGHASNAFNVGTGNGQSVLEVLRAVEEVTGRAVPYQMGPRRAGDPPELVANSDKLQHTLAWKPKYTEITAIVETAWQFEKNRMRSSVD